MKLYMADVIAKRRRELNLTQEEYDEMYQRIRAELMEELMQLVQISQEQQ